MKPSSLMDLRAALELDAAADRTTHSQATAIFLTLGTEFAAQPHHLGLAYRLLNLSVSARIGDYGISLFGEVLEQNPYSPQLAYEFILPAAGCWIDAGATEQAQMALERMPLAERNHQPLMALYQQSLRAAAKRQTRARRAERELEVIRRTEKELQKQEAQAKRSGSANRLEAVRARRVRLSKQAASLRKQRQLLAGAWPEPQQRLAWPAVERYGRAPSLLGPVINGRRVAL